MREFYCEVAYMATEAISNEEIASSAAFGSLLAMTKE